MSHFHDLIDASLFKITFSHRVHVGKATSVHFTSTKSCCWFENPKAVEIFHILMTSILSLSRTVFFSLSHRPPSCFFSGFLCRLSFDFFLHISEVFHLTRVYFERVMPPRARPLAIPPPNFLFSDDFWKFPPPDGPDLAPRRFLNADDLLVLMMSSKLISILSSILIL